MAQFWKVVKPEIDTNLIPNPSFEVDASLWSAISTGTISRVPGPSQGKWGGQFAPSSNTYDGLYSQYVSVAGYLTFAVNVLGAYGVPMRVAILNASNGVLASIEFTGDAAWHRYFISHNLGVGGTVRFAAQKNNSSSTADFYIDAAVATIGSDNHERVYFDGDMPGAYWDGARHASTSSIGVNSRKVGGRIYTFDELGVYVEGSAGLGVPPNKHLEDIKLVGEGSDFVGRHILPRTIQLQCGISGSSREDLHSKRSAFWDIIKPDAAFLDEEIKLIYIGSDSDDPVYMWGTYDSGFEYQGENGFTEVFPLRVIGYDPQIYGLKDNRADLLTNTSISNANRFVVKRNGAWNNAAQGTNGTVLSVMIKPYEIKGHHSSKLMAEKVLIGGQFATAGVVTVNRLAWYDPNANTYTAIGSGPGLNGDVYCSAMAPDGGIYIGGNFTDISGGPGGTYNYIVKLMGSTLIPLGSGMNGIVRSIAVGPDGTVYATGDFTTAGGTAVGKIAKWNGSAWSVMSTGLTGGTVIGFDLAVAKNGYVYVVGQFTTAGGVAAANVAGWNGSGFFALGAGLGAMGECILIASDGRIYVGGMFVTAGDNAANYVAMWNGSVWQPLGSGTSAHVLRLFEYKGSILASGAFITAGGIPAVGVAGWNGYTWHHIDVKLPGSPIVYDMAVDGKGSIYLGFDTNGTMYAGGMINATWALKKAAPPIFYFKRSGGTSANVKWIENLANGMIIYVNYALLDGETLKIDCDTMEILSDLFGPVPRAVLRNSDMSDFRLFPGSSSNNALNVFVDKVGNPTMEEIVCWRDVFWSMDK